MKKVWKCIDSILLAVCFVVTIMVAVPMTAKAEENTEVYAKIEGNNLSFYTDSTCTNPYTQDKNTITKVTILPNNISGQLTSTNAWFENMHSLTSIEGLERLNTSKVTEMGWMFCECNSLTSLDLSTFDFSKTEPPYGSQFFVGFCDSLQTIVLPKSFFKNAQSSALGTDTYWKKDNALYSCDDLTEYKGDDDLSGTYTRIHPYVISFYSNCDENYGTMKNQFAEAGSNVTLTPNIYTREGYDFVGWNTNSYGTGTTYADGATIGSDLKPNEKITLYAQWKPHEYIIHFDANGGNGQMEDQAIPLDIPTNLSRNLFTKKGYEFKEWKLENGNKTFNNGETVQSLGSSKGEVVTLTAQWAPITYKVSFSRGYSVPGKDRGKLTDKMRQLSAHYDEPEKLPKNEFVRPGYTFTNWRGNTQTFADEETILNLTDNATTVHLTAQWRPNVVTFDTNGGSIIDSIDYSEDMELPSEPTKKGYTFAGWKSENGEAISDDDKLKDAAKSGDIKIIAQWNPLKYTIKFHENTGSGTMDDQTLTYDDANPIAENKFTKSGYTFDHWDTQADDNGKDFSDKANIGELADSANENNEIHLYAQWKMNTSSDEGPTGGSTPGGTTGGGSGSGTTGVPPTHPVTPSDSDNGTFEVTPYPARTGDDVTITPKPNDGYDTGDVSVNDGNGKPVTTKRNADGTYTFKMPGTGVHVKVTFVVCPSKAFTDLDTSKWYHSSTDYVISNRLFSGIGNHLFAPGRTMTRGMFVTVLSRLEGIDENVYRRSVFTDVPTGRYYSAAVQWASENGIVSGVSSGKFMPEGDVTREQMAAIMYRYAQYKKVDTKSDPQTFNTFGDKDSVSAYAKDAMIWATDKGLIKGVGNNRLAPQEGSQRVQVAAIMKRYCEWANNRTKSI